MANHDKENRWNLSYNQEKCPRLPKCYQAYIDTCRSKLIVGNGCMYLYGDDSNQGEFGEQENPTHNRHALRR